MLVMYVEWINLLGKVIMLCSLGGFVVIIIDGDFDIIGWGSVIMCISGEDLNILIEGFMIMKGIGNSYGEVIVGGGMYNDYNSSLMVNNCVFSENLVMVDGGGMFNGNGSSLIVMNCVFIENIFCIGYSGNFGFGGGMSNFCGSDLILIDCNFVGNLICFGGVMFNG